MPAMVSSSSVWLRRLAMSAAALVALWLATLFVIGAVIGDSRGAAIADTFGEALTATASIDTSQLALIRGSLTIDGLRVRRDDTVGKLAIDIDQIDCELAPFGVALIDSRCRALTFVRPRIDASSIAVLRVARVRRTPLETRSLAVVGGQLRVVVGNQLIEVMVHRAVAGASVLKTPLSWLFSLEQLSATATTDLGTIDIIYFHGMLIVSGGLVAGEIAIAAPLPPVIDDEQPRAELDRVAAWGAAIAKQLVEINLRRMLGSQ